MFAPPTALDARDFRVSLVGAGALGSALAKRLANAGYPFVSIVNRTLSDARRLADEIGVSTYSDNLSDLSPQTNLLLLAVSDHALESVAEAVSKLHLPFHRLTVAQFSGALTTDALGALVRKGAIALSLHPFQTFPKGISEKEVEQSFKCYFGLQADELEGVEIGKKLAHDLGGKVMLVPKEAKTLYHIAGVMASNYLVTLASLSSEVFAALGLSPKDAAKVIEPIMRQTLSNIASAPTIADALTGPIERGDAKIIERHLRELSEQIPHLLPVYAALAIETARVAIHKGSISQNDASEILEMLETASRRESESEQPSSPSV
ncbi:MAG: DUF2520 domain-containing protein [Chloroherpetonaceae bacterium]|nr:DUF2520 domain-containing protein [Chloroherpetonaceae bacterium]